MGLFNFGKKDSDKRDENPKFNDVKLDNTNLNEEEYTKWVSDNVACLLNDKSSPAFFIMVERGPFSAKAVKGSHKELESMLGTLFSEHPEMVALFEHTIAKFKNGTLNYRKGEAKKLNLGSNLIDAVSKHVPKDTIKDNEVNFEGSMPDEEMRNLLNKLTSSVNQGSRNNKSSEEIIKEHMMSEQKKAEDKLKAAGGNISDFDISDILKRNNLE